MRIIAPRVVRLLSSAAGSSQPWFCLLEDQSEWLVKFSGAGPGPQALLAEFLANRLARHWGLPVPDTEVVRLDKSLVRAGTDEFWDVLAASDGFNLAIRKIPEALNVVPDLSISPTALGQMRAFDSLMVNWDRTTLSRNLMRDSDGKLWWIDHGSCRFLQAALKKQTSQLPSNHFLADVNLEGVHALPCPDLGATQELLRLAPDSWIRSFRVERKKLASDLHDYLRQNLHVE